MDKRHKTSKESLHKHTFLSKTKDKKVRIITGCIPIPHETINNKKIYDHQRIKFSFLSSQRAMTKSAVPLFQPLPSRYKGFGKLKIFQTNLSCTELPSFSEKTIKFVKRVEKKPTKLAKGKKKAKQARVQKEELERSVENWGIKVRKVGETKDDYQILYRKTEKILKEYHDRELQWQKQKNFLMSQLEDFRRKSMGITLTNCSTYSVNRKHFF